MIISAKGFRDDAKSDKLDKSQRKGVVESKKREKPPQNWNKDDVKQLGHMMSDVGNHDLKELPDKTVCLDLVDTTVTVALITLSNYVVGC